MKWIKDSDGDYFNLEKAQYIYIEDKGEGWNYPYSVIADMVDRELTVKSFKTIQEAQDYLEELVQ